MLCTHDSCHLAWSPDYFWPPHTPAVLKCNSSHAPNTCLRAKVFCMSCTWGQHMDLSRKQRRTRFASGILLRIRYQNVSLLIWQLLSGSLATSSNMASRLGIPAAVQQQLTPRTLQVNSEGNRPEHCLTAAAQRQSNGGGTRAENLTLVNMHRKSACVLCFLLSTRDPPPESPR